MNYIVIDNFLNLFNIDVITNLFAQLSELEENSYSIVKMEWADGSFNICFEYPTDFDNAKAEETVKLVSEKTLALGLTNLQDFLYED